MSGWRPMTEHVFPWDHRDIIVAVFASDDVHKIDLLRCHCAEHGALFDIHSGMLSIHEEGFIPFAWRIDDTPERDDNKFPPLLTDYLTKPDM